MRGLQIEGTIRGNEEDIRPAEGDHMTPYIIFIFMTVSRSVIFILVKEFDSSINYKNN